MMQGNFIWYELMTTDTAAASDFYAKVNGWKAKDSNVPGVDYTIFNVDGFEMGVAGMMALTPDMLAGGGRPGWMGYVAVDDVDRKADEFKAAGGSIHVPPTDIPQTGRFAVAADPQGAVICLFKPVMPDGPMPPAPAENSPGTFGWRELYAGDLDTAFDFYSGMFGWEKEMAVDMGAMGIYQTFKHDGASLGGMMTKMADMPAPFWNYYVNVDGIDAAAERVKSAGGQIVNGPHEVPGGSFIVTGLDPQGAMFSLVSKTR
ncbi:VOC family protein [Agrobacterium sp. ES01]|uniref:VOC family protein n=1 Tax=Agrobacterium sp. ES01 TaxID=3420714 RepID=UPI003D09FEEE